MITEVIENSKSDDYNDEKMIAAFSTIQISQFAYCSGSCSCGILYFRKEDEKMANVFDTAKYILEQSGSMSTMKLQKLCYYSQVWSLVWDDSPLFEEDFQAWANGPVCPELFFKTQGKYSTSASDETGGEGDLSENQKDTINKVLEYYGGL